MPNFALEVQVVRVGRYDGGSSPQRSPRANLSRSSELSAQNTVMGSLSGLMIHEWFQFVNKEKGARLETDKAVAALLQEAADLKADLFARSRGGEASHSARGSVTASSASVCYAPATSTGTQPGTGGASSSRCPGT
jgi:hypothetical protein